MANKAPTPEEILQYAKVSTEIYNQTQEVIDHSFDFIDSDCGCNSEKSKSQCVTVSMCLDRTAYEWLQKQDTNHHKAINTILHALMANDKSAQCQTGSSCSIEANTCSSKDSSCC